MTSRDNNTTVDIYTEYFERTPVATNETMAINIGPSKAQVFDAVRANNSDTGNPRTLQFIGRYNGDDMSMPGVTIDLVVIEAKPIGDDDSKLRLTCRCNWPKYRGRGITFEYDTATTRGVIDFTP